MDSRSIERNSYHFRMPEIYNFGTEKIEQSDFWLMQGEDTIFDLRYSLKKGKKSYGCPICKTLVGLSRSKNYNWFFRHHPRPDGLKCALVDENMPLLEKKIQRYNVAKETEEHKSLKGFIATYLGNDPNVIGLPKIEEIVKGTFTPHKWKRPDVRCQYGPWRLVFEVQISNTWLSDIVERDSFYEKNKTVIIWVFNSFDSCVPSMDITKADIFYNNPECNLFVLDEDAMEATRRTGKLTLTAHYKIPQIDYQKETIVDEWKKQLVTISDLIFDQETYKPYVVPYHKQRKESKAELIKWQETKKNNIRNNYGLKQRPTKDDWIDFGEIEKNLTSNESSPKGHNILIGYPNIKEENKHSKEERLFQEEFARQFEARKIENRCPKIFHEMSKQDCLDLILGEGYRSRNINNLSNRIKDLEESGFSFPINIIQILEDRKWIRRMTGNLSLIQYERV